jgi:hypothetical protein
VPATKDEDPVGALTADGADPAFGNGVRSVRPHRSSNDLDLFRGEYRIEACDELRVPIPEQETCSIDTIAEVHE